MMGGDRREWNHPVFISENAVTITDKEKAQLMVNTFVGVQSSNNLTKKGNQGREKTKAGNMEEDSESELAVPFIIGELKGH